MDEQRFLPEGWDFTESEPDEALTKKLTELKKAKDNNDTLEGIVTMADADFNLYVDLDGVKGIVPRAEVSATVGRDGLPMPVASITKVNKKVQFKIKDIKQENGNIEVILSRKDVEIEVQITDEQLSEKFDTFTDWYNSDILQKSMDLLGNIVNQIKG